MWAISLPYKCSVITIFQMRISSAVEVMVAGNNKSGTTNSGGYRYIR